MHYRTKQYCVKLGLYLNGHATRQGINTYRQLGFVRFHAAPLIK